ncbi:MAG: copper resistance protein [Acetobacteraceae bacterium]|jgi:methionine-rich copper-binding protein CopC|nr:copper resistance protein [Acetobacteraceae bacterium]
MRWIVILAAAACLTGQAAFAHAFLDRASPAVGSEVSGAPASVALTYSEPVEPLFSSIQVTDANGARVDTGKPSSRSDRRTLSVGLKLVTAGVYTVEWHVTSVDTHKTEGRFSFTVRP